MLTSDSITSGCHREANRIQEPVCQNGKYPCPNERVSDISGGQSEVFKDCIQ
ncbi:hypothetical protein DPMN_021825 [Dreissena polymorpha]|uniref:Uncharacterized protein n=1 Tax=Dreissena polymorpha TaxID=45954 RepID=A0A9D4SC27_DREPO|nr:hypothetical protein DPMN_021825 [Dreissena polymorpha]